MWLTWRAAIDRALYGESGFYLRERPSGHFRTSVSASAVFAEAVLSLLGQVDAELGMPGRLDLVDIGAGEGVLRRPGARRAPARAARPAPGHGRRPVAPAGRPASGDRLARRPSRGDRAGWPSPTSGWTTCRWTSPSGPPTGRGSSWSTPRPATSGSGAAPSARPTASGWNAGGRCARRATGPRSAGTRDAAWASVIERLERGRAIAVDYAHPVDNRPAVRHAHRIPRRRDGVAHPRRTCDITAHVALDACAEAGRAGRRDIHTLSTQRDALRALGITGARPPLDLARVDPRGYLRALRSGLGGGRADRPSGSGRLRLARPDRRRLTLRRSCRPYTSTSSDSRPRMM